MHTHKTERDACEQLMLAKVGAHVDATDTYLVALRAKLYYWVAEIDAELAKRDADRAARQEILKDSVEECCHESVTLPSGDGAYCRHCGETLA